MSVHRRYRLLLKNTRYWLITLSVLLPISWYVPLPSFIDGINYEPLYFVLQNLSIVIAVLIFAVGWGAHNRELPANFVFLICAFLGIGLLDLMETLGRPGKPLFSTSTSSESLIDFWLAARFLTVLALVSVLTSPRTKFLISRKRYLYPAGVLAFVLLLYGMRKLLGSFPELQLHDSLLLQMHMISEYVMAILFALVTLLIYKNLPHLQAYAGILLFSSAFLFMLSELSFVTYSGGDSPAMLLGYTYQLVAHLLIYRMVFMSAVQRPYAKLSESRQALQHERSFLQNILDGISDAIIVIDQEYKVLLMNRTAKELSLQPEVDHQLCHQVLHDDATPCRNQNFQCPMEEVRNSGKTIVVEHEYLDNQLHRRRMEVSAAPFYDSQERFSGIIEVARDITQRHEAQKRLRENQEIMDYLSRYDMLTGLPNRHFFQDNLHQAIIQAHKKQRNVALLFLDLDHFKNVNDTLGHEVGDTLLIEVANRLSACVREGDTVARLGGDEFTIIIEDLQHTHTVPLVARKIINSLKRSFHVEHHDLYISTSIGISIYPEDGHDVKTLVQCADAAMYSAKSRGRNNYQYFTEDMNKRAMRRLTLDARLRKALDNNELEVFYQPQVDIRSNKIVSCEALLRWPHSENGFIASPAEFIPLAEESGLIVPLGEWVMRESCTQNYTWQQAQLPHLVMAVNLSAQQFRQPDILERITTILEETHLDPCYLELELTESVLLVDDAERVVRLMQELKALGIRLSIDDFGTGYSSLSYLKRFPLDQLKVAQEFVRDLTTDPNDAAIAQAVISLSKSLGLQVIAEGVETKEHLAFFQQHQCELAQGYFFSPPLSAGEFTKLLQEAIILPGGKQAKTEA